MFSVSALVRLYRYPIIGHLAQRMVLRRGADIPRSVKIGHRVSFPHNALGTVLHPGTTLEDYVKVYQKCGAVRWLQLSLPPIYKPPVQGAFSFLGRGNLETPWLRFRPNADQSHGRTAEMLSIELCFSLHMDRLWRKAPSFAVNRATRALKLPLSGHKEPQAAAAGGLPSETDGLGRKESGFGNGQQDRGVGARVRARGVHGAGQRARARALLPVPGEGGGLAPRRAQVPLRRVRPGGDGRGGLPRPRRRRGARGGAGRGEGGIVSRRPSEEGRGRRAERDQGIDFPQGRRALIQARVQTACAFFIPHISIHTHVRICAYAQPHIFVFARLCDYASAHLGRYRHRMRARARDG